jgi:adenosylcobyric acid synthase
MSNNAAVTLDGGEIGRAQALQAKAAKVDPSVDMNPVLLKPESDTGAQVIVQGRRLTTAEAADYGKLRPHLLAAVMDSFERLASQHELVIVEGAGSPAEINLRDRDIANMGFAQAADVPVILAGDIDRGGVIAQIVGTKSVIDPDDAQLIKGFLVNRFRGDPRLFDDGYAEIERRTEWPGFGVLPWFPDAWKLPAEDAVDLETPRTAAGCHIVCLALSRIANFDDLDPLSQTPGVSVTMLGPGRAIPADADLVIIPGTKSTRGDLAFLRAQGWDIDIRAHVRRGGPVLGICGGYQILGTQIYDPEGIEGVPGQSEGLGLLDVSTTMTLNKTLSRITAQHVATSQMVDGYEIHIGHTEGPDCARPFALIGDRPEGAARADGLVSGTYLHGLFVDDAFRNEWLQRLGVAGSDVAYSSVVEETLDDLADHMERHLDVDGLFAQAR